MVIYIVKIAGKSIAVEQKINSFYKINWWCIKCVVTFLLTVLWKLYNMLRYIYEVLLIYRHSRSLISTKWHQQSQIKLSLYSGTTFWAAFATYHIIWCTIKYIKYKIKIISTYYLLFYLIVIYAKAYFSLKNHVKFNIILTSLCL